MSALQQHLAHSGELAPLVTTALTQELPELNEYLPHPATAPPQEKNKGDWCGLFGFADRYLAKKAHILVRFRRRGVNQDFLALIQRECAEDHNNSVVKCLRDLFEAEVDPLFERIGLECRDSAASSDEKPMLISDVHCMKSPENIIPSLVWFETFDFLNDITPHSIYFSVKSGLVDFGTDVPFEYWERRIAGDLPIVCDDEPMRHVVQRGSEILKGIPCNSADQRGNGRNPFYDVNFLAGFQIWFCDDFIRLCTHEALQFGTTIMDVLIGPLDL